MQFADFTARLVDVALDIIDLLVDIVDLCFAEADLFLNQVIFRQTYLLVFFCFVERSFQIVYFFLDL
jgi:hypothetical protein